MKASEIGDFGKTGRLRLVDRPVPAPKADEALVRIRATGLNARDLSIMQANQFGQIIPPSVVMVVYASILRDISVVDLFAAGILPGLLMAGNWSSARTAACWSSTGIIKSLVHRIFPTNRCCRATWTS